MRYLAVAFGLMTAQAYASSLEGVYSNVSCSRETGDQSGVELQLQTSAGRWLVVLKTCEGGCWQQPTSNVVLDKNNLTFIAVDQSIDESGRTAKSTSHRFSGRFGKDALDLVCPGYYELQHLERQHGEEPPLASSDGNTDKISQWPTPVGPCR